MARLGRFFNLEVHLDWSLLILIVLLAFGFSHSVPGLLGILFGLVYAVLLVLSIFAHEMGHVTVGRRYGVNFNRITLFMFGGAAHMGNLPRKPETEFFMALAGPAASLALATVGFLLYLVLPQDSIFGFLAFRVAYVNLFLGLFNLIPGFPLDGGRVFRSALWMSNGNFYRSTEIAGKGGMVVGYGMIGVGVLMLLGVSIPFFGVGAVSGIWLGILGYMIAQMAKREMQMTLGRRWR